jgi:uncharacterized protein (DUF736 family)
MFIGKFYNESNVLVGCIEGPLFYIDRVELRPYDDKKQEKSPDFRIVKATQNGDYTIGSAWRATSKNGFDYISARIMGIGMSLPIHFALMPNEDGSYNATFSESKKD